MLKAILKLKQKPESYRRAIAFWIALSITSVIFVVWVVSFLLTIDNSTSQNTQESTKIDVSPIQGLVETIGDSVDSFRALF